MGGFAIFEFVVGFLLDRPSVLESLGYAGVLLFFSVLSPPAKAIGQHLKELVERLSRIRDD